MIEFNWLNPLDEKFAVTFFIADMDSFRKSTLDATVRYRLLKDALSYVSQHRGRHLRKLPETYENICSTPNRPWGMTQHTLFAASS